MSEGPPAQGAGAPAGLSMAAGPLPTGRAVRLAHRGDWRQVPENTLAAFAAAMAIPGCDGVELDVRLSGDGVPVILHDETLARVQRRPERVDVLTADELGRADVPSLRAVLGALPPDAFVDVELKGGGHGAATAAVMRAARGEAPARAVVSSFETATLIAMGEHLPGWRRWLNAGDLSARTVAIANDARCAGIAVLWNAITPRAVGVARDAGLEVAAWTVRRRVTFDRLQRLGVVACCVEGQALDG